MDFYGIHLSQENSLTEELESPSNVIESRLIGVAHKFTLRMVCHKSGWENECTLNMSKADILK